MAEKGGNKILAIITICILLITVGISGCIGYDNDNKNSNEKYSKKSYKIKIITNSTLSFMLILPIPILYKSNNLSKLLDQEPELNGVIDLEIFKSNHGNAIRINGTGSSNLTYEYDTYEFGQLHLSMRETDPKGYGNLGNWMYCNSTDKIILSIDLYSEIGSPSGSSDTHEWITNYGMKQDWNIVKIKSEAGSGD